MSDLRTCLACGIESRDVVTRLVEIEQLADQRVVQAAIPTAEDQRGVAGFEYVDVRERYISEPRCRDTRACAGRVAALVVPSWVKAAEATVDEDEWLL